VTIPGFVRRAGASAALLVFVALSRTRPEAAPSASQPWRLWREARAEDESEAIDLRTLDDLERHGDLGRIDPERRLRRVAAEYGRRKAEAVRRFSAASSDAARWVSLGPTNGAGRMTAIAPVPGSPGAAYVGAAGGGVWKTTDGGASWTPLTDDLHDLSVGALAVAPSNPSVVYVGTGEGGYGLSFIPGIGLVKSTDGGATWILPDRVLATMFYRILVHPGNADELVAATNAGAFRSTDGGATWTNVIAHADYGDIPDMVRDPTDPRVLYATTWCPDRACSFQTARVLKSEDGGVTWSDRSNGLPNNTTGRTERTSIAIAPSNPRVLYAGKGIRDLARTGSTFSHIYKTTDGGGSWTDLPSVYGNAAAWSYLGFQSSYDNVIVVSPNDPNVVVAGGVTSLRSTDGGATFSKAFENGNGNGFVHPDYHDLQYHGSTLWIANDGGIWTSDDDGRTATARNTGLVTRQFYALAADPSNRSRIIAGSQDNGNVQRLDSGTAWRYVASGGDGIQCAIHPLSPEIAWASSQGGLIERTHAAGSSGSPAFAVVTPPFDDEEQVPFATVVRLDPREPLALYSASSRLWKSGDGGETWRPLPTGTADGSDWSATTTIRAVALPSRDSPIVMVAKGSGVFRSDDRGETWTAGRGLPNAVVTHVEIDPRDPSAAYACLATTTGPSVYRSEDGGSTWTASAEGLPLFAAQVLRIDPTDSSVLYCGTDVGLYRSTDRGASWARFGVGLPSSSIHDLQIGEDGSLLRVATHGRGVWELDVSSTPNAPPSARITSPEGAPSVPAGVPVEFAGEVGDPDAGDAAAGTWFFPDDGTTAPLSSNSGAVEHRFRRGGVFPVTLSARDGHGARSSAVVLVSVREPADDCGSPVVIPGSGPFPYTIGWNDEGGTTEATDPESPCFSGRGRAGSTWFEFTPSTTGSWVFSTCTDVSTAVSIFTGAACGPYAAVSVPCSTIGATDTGCGSATTSVTASAQAGRTLRILLGGIRDADVGSVRLTVAPSGVSGNAPRVERVGEAHGPVGGGTLVVIDGSGFTEGATVSFGGNPATEVAVLSTRVLVARTPPHAAGPVEVSVTVPRAGTGALANGFRYEAVESAGRLPVVHPQNPPPVRVVTPR
jgi:photosystem II stability/assembly factor-like uncharacterized protein